MAGITVASTEFKNRAGLYMEQSGKNPVFITRHNRTVRVLIDIEEYERLKARDTRKAYFAHELPEEAIKALENGSTGISLRGYAMRAVEEVLELAKQRSLRTVDRTSDFERPKLGRPDDRER